MGLLSEEVYTNWHNLNKKWFINQGYIFTRIGDEILVKAKDLPKSSHVKVYVKCDECNEILNMRYVDYLRFVKEDGRYYCNKCANELYGKKNAKNARLYKSISFAQFCIDHICEDFLEKYWDYQKNLVNPYEINYKSHNKIFIKCQKKDYHDSYFVNCYDFINGSRCPYCINYHGKVHPFDSLGKLLEDKNLLHIWSTKNKKSPYEYSPMSGQKVWWKCPEGKHKDFYRGIDSSNNICNFRCPECQYSKGEERISNYLLNENINYISQKTFESLIGLNGGLLSYDFYLLDYNLLIEYQGEQHEKPVDFKSKGKKHAEKQFQKQLEHDRRKREYAKINNMNLLEIWYWDFDTIEQIINKFIMR